MCMFKFWWLPNFFLKISFCNNLIVISQTQISWRQHDVHVLFQIGWSLSFPLIGGWIFNLTAHCCLLVELVVGKPILHCMLCLTVTQHRCCTVFLYPSIIFHLSLDWSYSVFSLLFGQFHLFLYMLFISWGHSLFLLFICIFTFSFSMPHTRLLTHPYTHTRIFPICLVAAFPALHCFLAWD